MTEEKVEQTGEPARWKTAVGVAVGILVGLGALALVWRMDWHVPFLTGWLSLKLAVKAGALTVGGLVAFVAWRAQRGKES
ncbi:hypothetical protein [Streptomyces sp. NPDC090445]|uniref:hypothetical protein n=1 Tax=Streptomyces sp. NPDC090445 TaxID=3365963 RepID=UPI003810847A